MPRRLVPDFLYEGESYKIRGACFGVYNALGGGIREKTIERALVKELSERGLAAESQVRVAVYYKGERIGVYVPDVVVNDKIIIEIKSKPFITKSDEKQFWSYLKGSRYELGFLVHFGLQRIAIQRFVHTHKIQAAD